MDSVVYQYVDYNTLLDPSRTFRMKVMFDGNLYMVKDYTEEEFYSREGRTALFSDYSGGLLNLIHRVHSKDNTISIIICESEEEFYD